MVHDAAQRTRLSWTRTAIAYTAISVAILKSNLVAGLVVLAMSPPIWILGRLASGTADAAVSARRFRLITVTIVVVAAAAVVVTLTARGPLSLSHLLRGRDG
jgi:uncharacterized membrane protein YidH (DUF202 family)